MKTKKHIFTFLAALLLAPLAALHSAVVPPPVPACYTVSDQLKLTANGVGVPVLRCTAVYDYGRFTADGPVTIILTAAEPITSYRISPLAHGINGTISGSTLSFTLAKPEYLIVKINRLREVVIAADTPETDTPASSGTGIYNVTAAPYQANHTGKDYATVAIQHAIDDAHRAGGGIVFVPMGVYKCGNLILKSNVSLYLQEGAVLRGSGLSADYTATFSKTLDGARMNGTWFLATAAGADRVKIFGRGTVDGNGQLMRTKEQFLNHVIMPLGCRNFTMEGVTVRDAGLWSVTPTRSENVTIRDVKILQENDVLTENDALDVQECQNVRVDHVIGISEDDSFSTKTWRAQSEIAPNWPGTPKALSNVTFNNCLAWTRCAAYKVGNGIGQDQTDVTFQNSFVYQCRNALMVEPKFGTATCRNLTFKNIDVEDYWPKRFQPGWLSLEVASASHVMNVKIQQINVRKPSGVKLKGFDANHILDGIRIEGITVDSVLVRTPADLRIRVTNEFVKDLTVLSGK